MDDALQQFTASAEVYDIIYETIVDYDAHAQQIRAVIRERCPGAETMLEMACGTGQFLSRFRSELQVVGSDLSQDMLDVCAAKHPDIDLHQGDYADVDIGATFDVVVCLFSSIGYALAEARLRQAIDNLVRHTRPGGVVVIDGWLRPEAAIDGFKSQDTFGDDGMLVARSTLAFVRDGHTDMYAGHLVNDGASIRYYTERHQMGLFEDETYLAAMADAGLEDLSVITGFEDRGRFVGSASHRGASP